MKRKYGRWGPKRNISRDFLRGQVGERAFQASCGFDLHVHLDAGCRTVKVQNERNGNLKKVLRMRQKAEKMSDSGAKGRSTADEDEFSEITKSVKRVDCLMAHGARSEKSATRGGKDRSRAGNCKISKSIKSEKGVVRL